MLQRTRRRCELMEEDELGGCLVESVWKWVRVVFVVEKVEAFALLIRKARESHVRLLT